MQRFKPTFLGNAIPSEDGDFYLVTEVNRQTDNLIKTHKNTVGTLQESLNSAVKQRDLYVDYLDQAIRRYEAVVAELEEAQEMLDALQPKPTTPWDHIQIDDPVIVWNNVGDDRRYSRHFARVDKLDNLPLTWQDGRTSWSSPDGNKEQWDNCQQASDFKSVNEYIRERPQEKPLKDYVVLYTIPGLWKPGGMPYVFTCKAINGYRAKNHCLNAISESVVIRVYKGADVNEALRKYHENL